ncbi:MAG TPA: ABC transporter ATP-binding protein, partial [Methylomirabilota bacterium]|nr:ABC transporter ATP-binding protein [Methylomirabilota bacterium]
MSALLEVTGVDFAYPPERRRPGRRFALSAVTFTLARGEILGVIGPNSAGKTTLIRLLTRVLEPAGGDIRLEGTSLRRLGRWE